MMIKSTKMNIFYSSTMLFEMTLMKFDAYKLSRAVVFLDPYCFCLYEYVFNNN